MGKITCTHIDYKISWIKDTGNKKEVYARVFEGVYELVDNVSVCVRKNLLWEGGYVFDKFPVDESEVKEMLKGKANLYLKNMILIPECQ